MEVISWCKQAGISYGYSQFSYLLAGGSPPLQYFKATQQSPFRGRLACACRCVAGRTRANFSTRVEKLLDVSSNERRPCKFHGGRSGCCLNLFRLGIERERCASGPGMRQLSAPAFSGGGSGPSSALHYTALSLSWSAPTTLLLLTCKAAEKCPWPRRLALLYARCSRPQQHTSKLQPEFRSARVVSRGGGDRGKFTGGIHARLYIPPSQLLAARL